jgi:predicted ArsR family transcriptional regulator
VASTPGSPIDSATARGRITAQLRRGERSVDEIARAVGTTSNAVRSHLSALERDGLVRNAGVRRGGGAGKPATLYALTADAELMFSRAYPAALSAVMGTLLARLEGPQLSALLRDVGARLAQSAGGEARGTLRERVNTAAAALVALGGDAEVTPDGDGLLIHGYGCPLGQSVAAHPETCRAVRAMVQKVTGAHTEERCEHGAHPQCRFRVSEAG